MGDKATVRQYEAWKCRGMTQTPVRFFFPLPLGRARTAPYVGAYTHDASPQSFIQSGSIRAAETLWNGEDT